MADINWMNITFYQWLFHISIGILTNEAPKSIRNKTKVDAKTHIA